MKLFVVTLLLLCSCLSCSAGIIKKDFFRSFIHRIDSTEASNIDTLYAAPFEKPWIFYVSSVYSGTVLSTQKNEGAKATLQTAPKGVIELGASYRGLGISFTRNLGNGVEQQFTFKNYGNRFGFDIILAQSNSLNGDITMADSTKFSVKEGMSDLRHVLISGYYVFRYKQFSYPAAMNYNIQQLQNSWSPIATISYYKSRLDVTDEQMTTAWDDIQRLALNSFSIGGGGAFNWVLGTEKRLLLHATFIPMLSIFQKNRVTISDNTIKIEYDNDFMNQKKWTERQNDYSNVAISYTARAGVNYNLKDFIFGFASFWNQYAAGASSKFLVRYNDWDMRFYIGYRL